MKTFTVKCKLVAQECDILNYHTLVFKILEDNLPFGHHYVMTTLLPNWDHRSLGIEEIGYLTYIEVIAGEDKWYDSANNNFIPYNYTNIYFIKFVKENEDNYDKTIILQ